MVASCCQHGRGVVPVGFIELIVIVFSLTKIIDDVSEQQSELRNLLRFGFREIADHFVGDFILCPGATSAAAVTRCVKYDLAILLDGIDRTLVPGKYFGQRQSRFSPTSGSREG